MKSSKSTKRMKVEFVNMAGYLAHA